METPQRYDVLRLNSELLPDTFERKYTDGTELTVTVTQNDSEYKYEYRKTNMWGTTHTKGHFFTINKGIATYLLIGFGCSSVLSDGRIQRSLIERVYEITEEFERSKISFDGTELWELVSPDNTLLHNCHFEHPEFGEKELYEIAEEKLEYTRKDRYKVLEELRKEVYNNRYPFSHAEEIMIEGVGRINFTKPSIIRPKTKSKLDIKTAEELVTVIEDIA